MMIINQRRSDGRFMDLKTAGIATQEIIPEL
jgi:hypothetical protein